MEKLKVAIILETIILVVVLILFIQSPAMSQYRATTNPAQQFQLTCPPSSNSNNQQVPIGNESKFQLISPRVSSGLLPPKSYLILNFQPLENNLRNYIDKKNLNVSVYVLNLRDGASLGIGEEESFEPASLNKLPVAIIILRKVEEGKLNIDSMIQIKNEYLDSKSGTLYMQNISQLSVRKLLHYMLAESDNTAFHALEEKITVRDLEHLSAYLNYYQEDTNYPSRLSNFEVVSPKSTANIFLSLYLSTVLQPYYSELILSELTNTSFDIHKYSQIPKNITISQKFGEYYLNTERYFHSCGIIYPDDSKIFYCVMTRDLDEEKGSETVGEITNRIYRYVITTKAAKAGDYKNTPII